MPLNRDNYIAQANTSPTSPGKKVRFTEEVEELMEITTSHRIILKSSKSVFETQYIAQQSDLTNS